MTRRQILSLPAFALSALSTKARAQQYRLAVPARKGDTTIHVRSTTGMHAGDSIDIDTGSSLETRKIVSVGTAAGSSTALWQPLPDGPVITVPIGSTNVPVTSASGFAVGEKIAIGYGATYPAVARTIERYHVATVTAVGKPGTQAFLGEDARAGAITAALAHAHASGTQVVSDLPTPGAPNKYYRPGSRM
jgi:hypothetical protein